MTISLCIERCNSLNLRYAGLEARDECFCGSDDRRYDQYGRLDDDNCNQACSGNPDEYCGAEYLMSVYDGEKTLTLFRYLPFIASFESETDTIKRGGSPLNRSQDLSNTNDCFHG